MDEQRENTCDDGTFDLKEAHAFGYEALSKELYIGSVYLRVYNDQPDSEISEPEEFCLALIDFISNLVHSAEATNADTHVNGDLSIESSGEQHSLDISSESGDGKATNSNSELIKNLQYGLISLQVWYNMFVLHVVANV